MSEEEQAVPASMFSSPAHPKKAYLKEIKLYFLTIMGFCSWNLCWY